MTRRRKGTPQWLCARLRQAPFKGRCGAALLGKFALEIVSIRHYCLHGHMVETVGPGQRALQLMAAQWVPAAPRCGFFKRRGSSTGCFPASSLDSTSADGVRRTHCMARRHRRLSGPGHATRGVSLSRRHRPGCSSAWATSLSCLRRLVVCRYRLTCGRGLARCVGRPSHARWRQCHPRRGSSAETWST